MASKGVARKKEDAGADGCSEAATVPDAYAQSKDIPSLLV